MHVVNQSSTLLTAEPCQKTMTSMKENTPQNMFLACMDIIYHMVVMAQTSTFRSQR